MLLLTPVDLWVSEDLKNCLWTQAPCQCMRHTPSRNPAAYQPDGRVCGRVLTVIVPWLQVRVGNGPTCNLGTFVNSTYPFLAQDQSTIAGLLGK